MNAEPEAHSKQCPVSVKGGSAFTCTCGISTYLKVSPETA